MKLLKKIKNWFKPLPPKESEVKKADYQLYADDSEEAKKIQAYQAAVKENTPDYLLLNTFSRHFRSLDTCVSEYWHCIEHSKMLHCQPLSGGKDFYIFATQSTKNLGIQGWIGFIVGSCKKVFVSEENHIVSKVTGAYEINMTKDCCLPCENISCHSHVQQALLFATILRLRLNVSDSKNEIPAGNTISADI